jgi:hypothetical protein
MMHARATTPASDQHNPQGRGSRATRRRSGLLQLALFAFPLWLALAPASSSALVGSSATNANIPMPMGAWTTLNAIVIPAVNAWRYCTAVGSADVNSPAGLVGTYLFTLTVDVPQPPMNLGQERTVQYVAGGPVIKEVGTTQGFALQPNAAHTIFWLGRPAVGNPGTVALDRSLTVVCDDSTVGIYNANPEPLLD